MPELNAHNERMFLGGLRKDRRFDEGYEALRVADYQRARQVFEQALRVDRSPEALEGLGMAVSLLGDDAVFDVREAAYEIFRQRNDRTGAARVALWLTIDCATLRGEMALANGWLQRAHTHLDGLPQSVEHGWLQHVEAQKWLLAFNDSEASRECASKAVEIARAEGDPDLEAAALAIEGISMVTSGAVREGLSRLDEAGASCLSGEVQAPWCVSAVMCSIMDACDRVRDWDRAREWFAHVERIATRWNDHILYGQCRPHYAVVLTWRGQWDEAERELQLSIEDIGGLDKPMAVEGIVRLAELRWRQGRWDEAAALFEQVKHEPLAQLGQAALALEQGEAGLALDLAQRCLRRLPEGDRLERMPALEMYVRACVAAGDCEAAREVLPEMETMRSTLATRPVQASVQMALGMLAFAEEGFEAARGHLEDAVDLYEQCSAPFEAARARVELARTLITLGRSAEAGREARSALVALEALGARGESDRARRLLTQIESGTAAPGTGKTVGDGLTVREREVLALLASGMSNQEIADRLVLSIRTVQRHVENIYSKTGARGRAAAAVFATTHNIHA